MNAVDRMKECYIAGTLLRYNLGDDYDGHDGDGDGDGDGGGDCKKTNRSINCTNEAKQSYPSRLRCRTLLHAHNLRIAHSPRFQQQPHSILPPRPVEAQLLPRRLPVDALQTLSQPWPLTLQLRGLRLERCIVSRQIARERLRQTGCFLWKDGIRRRGRVGMQPRLRSGARAAREREDATGALREGL